MPSYLIENSGELLSPQRLAHFDIEHKERVFSEDWLPAQLPVRIAVTSGASCPDVLMNQVVEKLAGFYGYGEAEISAGLGQLSLVD